MQHTRNEPPATMRHMAREALHDLIHFDSKLFRTLPPLLFGPGRLTEATLKGEGGYVRPFSLFVFLNFLFFLFKSPGLFLYTLSSYQDTFPDIIARKQATLHLAPGILEERFNTAMHFEQKEYLVIMVPLFALVVGLLHWRSTIGWAGHLVFALHFYAFLIVFMMVAPYLLIPIEALLRRVSSSMNLLRSQGALVGLLLVVNAVYLASGLHRVYRQHWWSAATKALILSGTVLALIVLVYRPVLFFIVLHAISEG